MDQNNRKGSGGNNKNMMGIVSIILWALIITLMINYFTSSMSTSRSEQIEYSQFVEMVENDEVAWVVMESNKYTIYPRPDESALQQAASSSGGSSRINAIKTQNGISYWRNCSPPASGGGTSGWKQAAPA